MPVLNTPDTHGKTNYSPLLFLIFYFVSFSLHAQTPAIEQLLTRLKSTETIADSVPLLSDISWEYNDIGSHEVALSYASMALVKAKELMVDSELATAYVRIGDALSDQGSKLRSIPYYDSSLRIEQSRGYLYGVGRASNQLAGVYRSLGEWDKSRENAYRAIKAFKKADRPGVMAISINILANTLMEINMYDSSLFYLNQTLEIHNSANRKAGIAESYLNMGSLFLRMRNYDRSVANSELSLSLYDSLDRPSQAAKALNNLAMANYELGELTKAEAYSTRSLKIREERADSAMLPYNYNTLGNIAIDKGEWDTAREYHRKALKIRQRQDDPKAFISRINLGTIEQNTGNHAKALDHYLHAYRVIDSLNVIEGYPDLLSSLSITYTYLGNQEKAILFATRFRKVKRDIEEKLNRFSNLEREVQAEQNRNMILEKEAQRQRTIIYALVAGIILIILLFFTIFRISQLRKRNLINQQNDAIQKQQIEKLIKEKEIEAINAMVEGQESERHRIARDLHDRLGATLSIVKMHFKSVEESIEVLKEKNVKQYKEANNLLDEACDQVRQIAHDMASGVLIKFGLVAALEALKETVETAGQLKINLIDIGLEERLTYEYEINIYRILQEILTNTLKHAQATEMNVQLFRKENSLSIVVEDNGTGFNPEKSDEFKGIGLKNIESRVYKFDGEVSIDSGKGAGTTIAIDLPLNKERL